jgi:hypothetical protein
MTPKTIVFGYEDLSAESTAAATLKTWRALILPVVLVIDQTV